MVWNHTNCKQLCHMFPFSHQRTEFEKLDADKHATECYTKCNSSFDKRSYHDYYVFVSSRHDPLCTDNEVIKWWLLSVSPVEGLLVFYGFSLLLQKKMFITHCCWISSTSNPYHINGRTSSLDEDVIMRLGMIAALSTTAYRLKHIGLKLIHAPQVACTEKRS